MESIKKSLNYIGLTIAFLGLLTFWIYPQYKTIALAAIALGILAVAVYIILNMAVLKQGIQRKSFLYSSNMFLIVILVLAILSVANSFLSRHHKRFDFTSSKIHSLSDQSVKVVENLKNDVVIKAFYREDNFSRAKMEDLLKLYAYHSKKIKYELIDPDKNPGLIKRYEITQDGTTIFECADKENRVTSATEEDVTNAVIKVSREKKKSIYFLEGHGEPSIEESNDNGYSLAKDELSKLGYEAKKLSLALPDSFPKDCSLLVIPGPDKELLPNELETIKNYINGGGRVFFMIEPMTKAGTELTPFLASFGFKLADDVIIDTISRLFGGDDTMPVVSEYESHEITRKFRYATFFPFARTVDLIEPKPEGITSTILAKTSSNAWSERELDKKTAKFNKDKDIAGPVPLAAVAVVKVKEPPQTEAAAAKPGEAKPEEKTPEASPKKEGRIAVFGDSDFPSNRYYYKSGNGNLFLNTVNWLTEESDLISIQAKTSQPRVIQLTRAQGQWLFFLPVVILPLIVLVTGIFIWVRRRSL